MKLSEWILREARRLGIESSDYQILTLAEIIIQNQFTMKELTEIKYSKWNDCVGICYLCEEKKECTISKNKEVRRK